jgi:hypothetical protein
MAAAVESLKDRVRQREQLCVHQLLELHQFRQDDFAKGDLPLTEGRWGIDLFSPAAMKQFGIRTGGAAAAGALVGLSIDAMVGGISLGAASALGAAIGALLGAGHTHGKRIVDQLRGRSDLRCDDATLKLLIVRQVVLIRAMLRRGHASMQPIHIGADRSGKDIEPPRRLPSELDEAKIRPQWSRLNPTVNPAALTSISRRLAQDGLTQMVSELLKRSPSARG